MLDFIENPIIISNISNKKEENQKINITKKKKIKITGKRKLIPYEKKN
jgi:hypothetical protein